MLIEPTTKDVEDTGDGQQEGRPVAVGWLGKIEAQYRKTKEHAETYPYVWASYTLVYGGFGLWLTYRWRKLRKTEDRVRGLQERLRKLVEEENQTNSAVDTTKQSSNSASSMQKPPASKPAK